MSPEMQEQLNRKWKELRSGITLSDSAASLSSIARILQQENRIGEAVAMARLAYLYGPEIDKAAHRALFAKLLEEAGRDTQNAAEFRAELDNLRKEAGRTGK
jgi:hypothetical protein